MEKCFNPVVAHYTRLLIEVCPEGLRPGVASDFQALESLIDQDLSGWNLLTEGGLSPQAQWRIVTSLLAHLDVGAMTRRFLHVLTLNKRLKEFPDITASFARQVHLQEREPLHIIAAAPLHPSEISALKRRFMPETPDQVVVEQHIDPRLLGGTIIFWQQTMIDSSAMGLLKRLERASV